ncbi:MAG: PAS domain-containing protein [Archangiaceae bacterium]|nr:PAS domain-containing protein [Archangiaceae bacterium]
MSAEWIQAALPEGLALEVLDQLPHPVVVKDRTLRFVVVNHAMGQLVGQPREAMLGKSDFDFFPMNQAQAFRAADEQVIATRQPLQLAEEVLTDARGAKRVLATRRVPLAGSDGSVSHVLLLITDVTWLKLAQEAMEIGNRHVAQQAAQGTAALEAARDELLRKERIAVLGRLAGGLAHQIRNPLAAVLNAAVLLKRRLGAGAEPVMAEALKIVEEEAWAANRIISDVVDFSRVRQSEPVEIGLSALVDAALAANPPPHPVKVVRTVGPAHVWVDEAQTLNALGSLVRNAYEAMSTGGTVRIEGREEGPWGVLALEDQGPGFAREIESRLFEPLISTKPLGLGLGLTTARLLLEGQGGRLNIARLRPGARLEVWLPARKG